MHIHEYSCSPRTALEVIIVLLFLTKLPLIEKNAHRVHKNCDVFQHIRSVFEINIQHFLKLT